MNLDTFTIQLLRKVFKFEDWYKEQHKLNPDQYPLEFLDDNYDFLMTLFFEFEE